MESGFLNVCGHQLGYPTDGSQKEESEIFMPYHTETEWKHHNFCLSQSHYTDINPTNREWGPRAGIKTMMLPPLSTELPHVAWGLENELFPHEIKMTNLGRVQY